MNKLYKKYFSLVILLISLLVLITYSFSAQGLYQGRSDFLTYLNSQLNYSINYPADWKLTTYKSNSYSAIGLYDQIAQKQDPNIPDLIQGAKIEISAHDFIPESSIRDYILERNKFLGIEQITNIYEVLLDNERISAIRDEHVFKNNKGIRVSFIGRDAKFYTISLGIPNYEHVEEDLIEIYLEDFGEILHSFKFLD